MDNTTFNQLTNRNKIIITCSVINMIFIFILYLISAVTKNLIFLDIYKYLNILNKELQ